MLGVLRSCKGPCGGNECKSRGFLIGECARQRGRGRGQQDTRKTGNEKEATEEDAAALPKVGLGEGEREKKKEREGKGWVNGACYASSLIFILVIFRSFLTRSHTFFSLYQ